MQKLVWRNSIGDEIDLTSAPYGITSWEGFANTSLNIQSQQVPFQDGGVFLDALMEQRELSVTLAIQDKNNLEDRYKYRRELIHILNPKLGEGYLIYTNDFISKRIKCVAQIPLFETHNSNDSGTPKASLSWTACEPYWEDLEETIIALNDNQRTVITNNGDVSTQIKAEIKLQSNGTNLVLENDNGQKIEIKGNYQKDEVVLINTNNGQKGVDLYNVGYETLRTNLTYFVVYSAERDEYLAIGNKENVGKSKDGKKWNYSLLRNVWGDVIKYAGYSNTLHKYFMMKATSDTYSTAISTMRIYTSTDGIDWDLVYTFTNTYRGAPSFYFEETGIFLVSTYSKLYASTDLVNWNEHNKTAMTHIVYGQNKYVGISLDSNYNSTISYSTDLENWTDIAVDKQYIDIIAYSEELQKFVVLFRLSNAIYFMTSDDGINWNLNSMEHSLFERMYCLSFQNGYFLGTGSLYNSQTGNYPVMIRSETGDLWEKLPTDLNQNNSPIINFIYHNAMFIAGGEGFVSYSYNGYQYPEIEETIKGAGGFSILTYQKGIFLLRTTSPTSTGYNGDYLYISKDGVKWELSLFHASYTIYNVKNCYYKEKDIFIIVVSATSNTIIITSRNAKDWVNVFSTMTSYINVIIYSGFLGMFFGVGGVKGDNTKNAVVKSSDGENWSYIEQIIESSNIADIISVETKRKLYMFEITGYIYTSSDGETWTKSQNRFLEGNDQIRQVSYSEYLNLFCISVRKHGGDFALYVSKDLINWNFITGFYPLGGLRWEEKNKRFVISTSISENNITTGGYYTSYDGFNWTLTRIETQSSIGSICYNDENDTEYFGNSSNIIKEIIDDKTNVINSISNESDMNFNLSIGQNVLLSRAESGKILTKLKYRQKYIGV